MACPLQTIEDYSYTYNKSFFKNQSILNQTMKYLSVPQQMNYQQYCDLIMSFNEWSKLDKLFFKFYVFQNKTFSQFLCKSLIGSIQSNLKFIQQILKIYRLTYDRIPFYKYFIKSKDSIMLEFDKEGLLSFLSKPIPPLSNREFQLNYQYKGNYYEIIQNQKLLNDIEHHLENNWSIQQSDQLYELFISKEQEIQRVCNHIFRRFSLKRSLEPEAKRLNQDKKQLNIQLIQRLITLKQKISFSLSRSEFPLKMCKDSTKYIKINFFYNSCLDVRFYVRLVPRRKQIQYYIVSDLQFQITHDFQFLIMLVDFSILILYDQRRKFYQNSFINTFKFFKYYLVEIFYNFLDKQFQIIKIIQLGDQIIFKKDIYNGKAISSRYSLFYLTDQNILVLSTTGLQRFEIETLKVQNEFCFPVELDIYFNTAGYYYYYVKQQIALLFIIELVFTQIDNFIITYFSKLLSPINNIYPYFYQRLHIIDINQIVVYIRFNEEEAQIIFRSMQHKEIIRKLQCTLKYENSNQFCQEEINIYFLQNSQQLAIVQGNTVQTFSMKTFKKKKNYLLMQNQPFIRNRLINSNIKELSKIFRIYNM